MAGDSNLHAIMAGDSNLHVIMAGDSNLHVNNLEGVNHTWDSGKESKTNMVMIQRE